MPKDPAPVGTLPGPAGWVGHSRFGWSLRLRSAHVREQLRRRGSPPDRGRDGARLGALARGGAPADRRTRGGAHRRALRGTRGPRRRTDDRSRTSSRSGSRPEERAALGDPPTGHGLLGALTREARPLRIPDIGADPRSVGFPPNHPPMKSLLGAPDHRARDRCSGTSTSPTSRAPRRSTRRTSAILVVLATQAAIAVENARLYDETERKGRELQRLQVLEERERIGKELHDGVIQSLFAVGMSLQGLASSTADAEDRDAPRSGRRGCRWRDPRPPQLHLRSATRDPRRPTARPGAQGDGDRVRSPHRRRDGRRRRRRGRIPARLARRRRGAARA